MTIAATIKRYLDDQGVAYEVVTHSHTGSSMETAASAHVSGEALAKAIVLKDDDGFVMAVMPSTHKLEPGMVPELTDRRLEMVGEDELGPLFEDCELGAVPPLAAAYGLEAVWDEALAQVNQVFFEGGDHAELVRVSGEDFRKLMGDAPRSTLSHHI